MTPSFRHLARESVGRARAELASADRARLKFAALELRMAIESVTYERAQSYRDEIPQAEYRTWQPKKVMQLLIDIEPHADKGSSIAYGVEEVPGVVAKEMTSIGAEQVFDGVKNLVDLKLTFARRVEVGEPRAVRLIYGQSK